MIHRWPRNRGLSEWVSVAATCAITSVLLALPADVDADGRHARLSGNLHHHLDSGNTSDVNVIVTASRERINALARRHGLQIAKQLDTGAVFTIPAGALAAFVDDDLLDQVSDDDEIEGSMDVETIAIGADQARAGAAA